MANQIIIDIGAVANDGTGDPLRTAFGYVNNNFSNVWATGIADSNISFSGNRILTTNVNGNLVLAPNGIGKVQANVDIVPNANNTLSLGSLTRQWNTVYAQNLDVGGNVTFGNLLTDNLTVDGNLTVQGNIIQIGNLVTDAKTIQLANTAGTDAAANGSGITVGASDNIATLLYNSTTDTWNTNIGINSVGNVTAPYFFGNGSQLTGLPAGYANANVTTLLAGFGSNTIVTTGNITGGNILTGGIVSAIGNITGNYFIGNGSQLTGISSGVQSSIANGTSNVSIATANGNATITANAATYTFGTNESLTLPGGSRLRPLGANLDIFAGTGSYVNLITADESSYMGVNGGGGYVVTAGGTWNFGTTGNLNAPGNVSAVGNITAGNLIATGNIVLTGSLIGSGASPAPSLSGFDSVSAITVSASGNISATGNITAGNISITGSGNVTGNLVGRVITGTQSGITSLGTLTNINTNGNANVAQTVNSTTVVATGNITGGNLIASTTIYGNVDLVLGNTANASATKTRIVSFAGNSFIQTGNGTVGTTGNIVFSPYLDTTQRIVIDTASGNLSVTGNISGGNILGNGASMTGVATMESGAWTVTTGTANYSFTVPANGVYQLWVRGNINNGIITYIATVSVTNTNVPVLGQQFAWNYTDAGSPILITAIPNQIVGTAGAIANTIVSVGSTSNTFVFGISNTSGGNVTVNYGYTKLS